jgi:hypothetical protein
MREDMLLYDIAHKRGRTWHKGSHRPHRRCADICARIAAGLSEEQVQRVWRDIASKRKATRYLHAGPMLVEPVLIGEGQ